jgi:hypothetical protein
MSERRPNDEPSNIRNVPHVTFLFVVSELDDNPTVKEHDVRELGKWRDRFLAAHSARAIVSILNDVGSGWPKAVAIAVHNVSDRRRWSKLRALSFY